MENAAHASPARGAVRLLRAAWGEARDLGRVVWVCRISVASVAAGFLVMSTEQGQDLFADRSAARSLASLVWFWALFYVGAFALWAIPVHISARWILDDEAWLRDPRAPPDASEMAALRARFAAKRRIVPRALGQLCFVAILYGQVQAVANLYGSRAYPLVEATVVQLRWLVAATLAAALVFHVYVHRRRALAAAFAHAVHEVRGLGGRAQERMARGAPYALLVVPFVALAWSIFDPIAVSERFPRAQFLVLLVGSWVPFLTAVALWSHRLRAPLVLLLLAALGTLSAVIGDIHDVRTIAAGERPGQIDLHAAVSSWRRANGCAPLDLARPPPDPDREAPGAGAAPCEARPILVAASGGASRAAFHTGSVLGELLDLSRTPEAGAAYRDFGTQTFAISGVSGGALGAVVFAAALEDARLRDAAAGPGARPWAPPCRRDDDDLYFGTIGGPGLNPASPSSSWRSCLQALLSGDFLSAVFVGLVFRDPVAPRGAEDRAALLERAWENRYRALVGGPGLERPFAALAPEAAVWRPLLVLNGASVTNGRRILLSHLAPHARPTPEGAAHRYPQDVFQGVYDADELLNGAPGCPPGAARGLRLSTAATMSARFPIVSPHGAIRDCADRVAERVVDGGYFENDGATTTDEIAWALRNVYGLRPVVVHLRNAPRASDPPGSPPRNDLRRPLAPEPSIPFAIFAAPLRTLLATRLGRAETAVQSLIWQVDDGVDPAEYYSFEVYDAIRRSPADASSPSCSRPGPPPAREAAMRQVSMSWWMSAAVQTYLDDQRCDARNAPGLARITDVLRR